jgi:hypothetical protein
VRSSTIGPPLCTLCSSATSTWVPCTRPLGFWSSHVLVLFFSSSCRCLGFSVSRILVLPSSRPLEFSHSRPPVLSCSRILGFSSSCRSLGFSSSRPPVLQSSRILRFSNFRPLEFSDSRILVLSSSRPLVLSSSPNLVLSNSQILGFSSNSRRR